MENASKALLIAGGMLIALITIGALVLMFNQIGDYGKAQNTNKKDSKIAEFNLDFEKYLDDKGITGADVISLYNKVNDYNQKSVDVNSGKDAENSIDYSIKITLTVKGLKEFSNTYSSDFLQKGSYTITNNGTNYKNNELKEALENGKNAENLLVKTGKLTTNQLKELSGLYNSKKINESKDAILSKYREIKNDDNANLTNDEMQYIYNYRGYWEFKTAKFKPDGDIGYADNGQINKIAVIFDK